MQACIIIGGYQTILLNIKNRFEIHKNFIGNVFIFIAPAHIVSCDFSCTWFSSFHLYTSKLIWSCLKFSTHNSVK